MFWKNKRCQQWIQQHDFLYYFFKDKLVIASTMVFLLFLLAAVFAPWLAPYNPNDLASIDLLNAETPPMWLDGGTSQFILGTDNQGRGMLSTILYGLRISMMIGLGAVLLQAIIGICIGLVSGFFRGKVDSFFMRLSDIQLSFSTIMLAIIVAALFKALFGPVYYAKYAVLMLIVIIGFAEWPQYARSMRASVMAQMNKEYVEAAYMMRFSSLRIMFKHILPNCLSPIWVIATVQLANAIMSEAALSFLGLGIPVEQPSLGSLINTGFNYVFSGSWWITVFPGIALVILVLVVNLIGDWLRDVLDPKYNKG